MVKIGITGGIGSGKSTVCDIWQSQGAYIINADDLAKDIMVKDDAAKHEIIEVFGAEAYHPDGSLNRRFLAEQAFEKGRVEELNAIVHPRIPEEVNRLMHEINKQDYKAIVYEAALLLQNLEPDYLDYIVLVLADEQKRVQRVQDRDNVEANDVYQRVNNQQDFSTLTNRADRIIYNNGSLRELEEQSKSVFQDLVSAFTE